MYKGGIYDIWGVIPAWKLMGRPVRYDCDVVTRGRTCAGGGIGA